MVSEVDRYLDKKWNDEVVGNKDIPKEYAVFYRIPIDNKYYKNFLFFQQSQGYAHERQKEEFYYVIDSKIKERNVLNRIDKTINKFLTSYRKAKNTYYAPLTSKHLKGFSKYLFAYMISFDRAYRCFNVIC